MYRLYLESDCDIVYRRCITLTMRKRPPPFPHRYSLRAVHLTTSVVLQYRYTVGCYVLMPARAQTHAVESGWYQRYLLIVGIEMSG